MPSSSPTACSAARRASWPTSSFRRRSWTRLRTGISPGSASGVRTCAPTGRGCRVGRGNPSGGRPRGNRPAAAAAPEWPRKHGDVEDMRETPEDSVGLGVKEIVDHYEALIRELDQPPVLIGHSYGGLFVELLLDRGLGRAGVAMSPAPPKGILALPFSTLKAGSPALAHPSKWHGVVTLTPEEFTYGFVNTFTPEKAKEAYDRYCVPETGQIFYEAGFANFHLHPPTEVHFKNGDRAPLLIVGADEDHTVPAKLSKAQYKKYERSPAHTDYLEFAGRPHLHMVADGWEEVAEAVAGWIESVPAAPAEAVEGAPA
ncbi:MAG: alpha/beta hydrolase [Actinobacteria bacterium]|nr:MAG: alpha/beta hydrolase [Actinomycetota bacterium]